MAALSSVAPRTFAFIFSGLLNAQEWHPAATLTAPTAARL